MTVDRLAVLTDSQLAWLERRARRLSRLQGTESASADREAWTMVLCACIVEHAIRSAA